MVITKTDMLFWELSLIPVSDWVPVEGIASGDVIEQAAEYGRVEVLRIERSTTTANAYVLTCSADGEYWGGSVTIRATVLAGRHVERYRSVERQLADRDAATTAYAARTGTTDNG